MCIAANTSGLRTPSGVGTVTMISFTPATRAGITVINTVDGYAACPPGNVNANAVERRHPIAEPIAQVHR